MLFEAKYTNKSMIYLWKGIPADKQQRPMYPYYTHCSTLVELKGDSLFNIRMKAIKKFFSTKDSTHANIYRHYNELERY